MLHCGDMVKVLNVDRYADKTIKDRIYIIVGIHPVNVHGRFSKDYKEIQFICKTESEPDNTLFLVGEDLHKVGSWAYNTEIFDKPYPIDKLLSILDQPQNIIESFIFSRCKAEIDIASSKFGNTTGAKIKIRSIGWGKDYATIRGNCKDMRSSLSVHIWKDTGTSYFK